MFDPRTILIATDFSEWGDRAVRSGVSMARRLGARAVILHVIQENIKQCAIDYMVEYCLQDDFVSTFERELTKSASDRLACMVDELRPSKDVRLDYEVKKGTPAEVILEEQARLDADLIVIGPCGRAGRSRHVLGATAVEILRSSPCPVFLARS
jgi:nucleotide-binding universal stress UspA family protein